MNINFNINIQAHILFQHVPEFLNLINQDDQTQFGIYIFQHNSYIEITFNRFGVFQWAGFWEYPLCFKGVQENYHKEL